MNAFARLIVPFILFVFLTTAAALGQQAVTPAQSTPSGPTPAETTARLPDLPPTTDPKEIVRRSVEADHRSWELARSYTCQQREVEKKLGSKGEVKSTEVKTYDINFYYGQEYSRLILKDDKPLNDKDQKKEDEKLEKFLSKLRNQSEEEHAKHEAK